MSSMEVLSFPGKHSLTPGNWVNLDNKVWVWEGSLGKTWLTSLIDQEGLRFQKEKKKDSSET